jgi:hypothetical protein
MSDLATAYRATGPSRVDFQAIVASAPRFFFGVRTHCTHEAFEAATDAGPVEVVDNVNIAPRCPVQVGDRVEVCGVMEHDPGRPPVVHWTHHDPSGRHPSGFSRWRGRLYA